MSKDKACIFCEIGHGHLESSKVYEDDLCLAFMDIHPLGDGHVLIIPKQHVKQLTELAPAVQSHLFSLANAILAAQRKCGLGLDGTNILVNDGPAANQTVGHCHIHVIPRKKGDALGSIFRVALHVTGIFGFARKRHLLDDQAARIKAALQFNA